MKKIILILSTLLLFCSFNQAQQQKNEKFDYKYRLTLKDKGTEKKKYKPIDLLSKKSLERRIKQGINVTTADYPFSEKYISKIEKLGGRIVAKSRWNNTIVIAPSDSSQLMKIEKLPFIEKSELVWRGNKDTKEYPDSPFLPIPLNEEGEIPKSDSFYGEANKNIELVNGQYLHNKGFTGDGMIIAVIDGGFRNTDKIEYLDNINILGTKDFVDDSVGLFRQDNEHGTNVLSCIATNKPFEFVGTAPNASFFLLGSEDERSEYPIEEDYWAAAIEYADSIGVDVINTSLGYSKYDEPIAPLTHDFLDGKSTLISRTAEKASKNGMILVLSAGNSGRSEWKKITPPGDAAGVLTIGAMKSDSIIAPFSSRGATKDLRIKPDIVALGVESATINKNGKITPKNGTSFASPIMAGLVTCLWQAFPTLKNEEILDVIRMSSNNNETPNVVYGFGVPDMEKAYKLAEEKLANRK